MFEIYTGYIRRYFYDEVFDTIKEIGQTGKTNTILIPHSPGGMSDIANQIRDALIVGNETSKGTDSNSQPIAIK